MTRQYVNPLEDMEWSLEMLRERGAAYVRQEFPDVAAIERTELDARYRLMTPAERLRSRALFDFRQVIAQEVDEQWGLAQRHALARRIEQGLASYEEADEQLKTLVDLRGRWPPPPPEEQPQEEQP